MIYIVDSALFRDSHSWGTIHAIERVSSSKYCVFGLPDPVTVESITSRLILVLNLVTEQDVVLLPWVSEVDAEIEDVVRRLTFICPVIVAAGNNSGDISEYSPARMPEVITVGCLNKSGFVASLSNNSKEKTLEWVVGTNFHVGEKTYSGTSVSAAIYAAFVHDVRCESPTDAHAAINNKIGTYTQLVKSELL